MPGIDENGDPLQAPWPPLPFWLFFNGPISPLVIADPWGRQRSFPLPPLPPFAFAFVAQMVLNITQQDHQQLELLVHQPNHLLKFVKQLILLQLPLPGFRPLVDFIFTNARQAILREVIFQLRQRALPKRDRCVC